MALFGPIGIAVTVKWHWIGNAIIEWSFIGLIGSTVTVKWHWICIGLVEWSFIGIKVI